MGMKHLLVLCEPVWSAHHPLLCDQELRKGDVGTLVEIIHDYTNCVETITPPKMFIF